MSRPPLVRRRPDVTDLPPGQQALTIFPRFGVDGPEPEIPAVPHVAFGGDLAREPILVADLADLPRHAQVSDFHCVAGWSVRDLRWHGVRFADVYRDLVEPSLTTGGAVTCVVVEGHDGFRAVLDLRDALADDVLLADRLDDAPLGLDHGAPLRLVSPRQYGFMSVKHVCRIEAWSSPPPERHHRDPSAQRALSLLKPHRRARVWHEERHRYLPARVVRPVYHALWRARFARRGIE